MSLFKNFNLMQFRAFMLQQVRDYIDVMPNDEIMNTDLDQLKKKVFEQVGLVPVDIDIQSGKIVSRTRGKTRKYCDTREWSDVESADIVVEYRFSGSPFLFGCYDENEYNPHVLALSDMHEIDENRNALILRYSIPFGSDLDQELKKKNNDDLTVIRQHIDDLNREIEKLNNACKQEINSFLTVRKNQLSKLNNISL